MQGSVGGRVARRRGIVDGLASALMSAAMTLAAGAALGGATSASAQTVPTYGFDIPSQPLTRSLRALADRSGLQIAYDTASASGVTSPAVSGLITAEQALVRLLGPSGLTYRFTDPTTVTLARRGAAGETAPPENGSLVLDTINVTAGGATAMADAPFETSGSSAYISSEQIERVATGRGSDIFKTTPGVISASGHNGSSINVNIRGMQGMNRVNMAVDGAQQTFSTYRGYMGVDNRTYVDPDFLGGVSIAKGPSSGALGAGFNGGVVDMRTIGAADVLRDGQFYGVRIKGGVADNAMSPDVLATGQRSGRGDLFDFESGYGNIAGAAKGDHFEVLAAYGRRKAGNYSAGSKGEAGSFTPVSGGRGSKDLAEAFSRGDEVPNTSFDTQSALVKGAVFNDEHRLDVSYGYYDSEYGEMWLSDVGATSDRQKQKPLNSVTSNRFVANYAYDPASNLINFKLNAWSANADETQYLAAGSGFSRSFIKTQTWGVDFNNSSLFTGAWGELSWRYGASYAAEDTDPADGEVIIGVDGTRKISSLFTNLTYKPTHWLTVGADLQHVRYDMKGDALGNSFTPGTFEPVFGVRGDGAKTLPGASVTVEPWKGLQIFAKYAEGYRPPSIRELSNPFVTFVNPNLKPEEAQNWEVGVNALRNDTLFEDDKLSFKAAYFNNTYKNYIVRSLNYSLGSWITDNISKAKFEGVEIQLNYDMGRAFANFAYTHYTKADFGCPAYARPTECEGGSYSQDYAVFNMPPESMVSLTLGARFLEERIVVGGRMTYVDERKGGPAAGLRSVTWNEYAVFDLFGSYKVNDHVSMNASLENVTDRFYMDALNTTAMPAPGRTFRLGVTASF